MKFEFDTKEFENLAIKIKSTLSLSEKRTTDKKIVDKCAGLTHEKLTKDIPRSENNKRSGRAAYKPKNVWHTTPRATRGLGIRNNPSNGHAADNIPIGNFITDGDGVKKEVGWKLSDNSEYFYMKFLEWGTVRMEPRPVLKDTMKKLSPDYMNIAEEEYDKVMKEL